MFTKLIRYFLLIAGFIFTSGCKFDYETESMMVNSDNASQIRKMLVSNPWQVASSGISGIRQGETYYFNQNSTYDIEFNGALTERLISYNLEIAISNNNHSKIQLKSGTFNIDVIRKDMIILFIGTSQNTVFQARLIAIK